MTSLKKKTILNAIDTWKEYSRGVYPFWEKNRYSKEYCLGQVVYFKEMLKKEK